MPRTSTSVGAGNTLALQHGARSERIVRMYTPRVGAKLRRIAEQDPIGLYDGILAEVTVQSGLVHTQLRRGRLRGAREHTARADHQEYVRIRIGLVDRIVAARAKLEQDPQAMVARIRARQER